MSGYNVQLPFFVYGTLLPGQPNFYLWREAIERVRPAVLPRSCLYDLGCYPMLVDAPAGEVRGLVVTIRPSSYRAAVALLDRLEGIGGIATGAPVYKRARRIARTADGQSAVVWVYVGDETSVIGLKPIGSDWKVYLRGSVLSAG